MGFLLIEYTQDYSFSKLFREKGEKERNLYLSQQMNRASVTVK